MPSDNDIKKQSTPKGIYDNIISILYFFYKDIKANIVLFLVCIVGITLLFTSINMKKSNAYSASFTVVYEELVRKVYGDRIEKLDILLNNNRPKTQKLLGLGNKAMESFTEVSGTNILGESLSKDMNTDRIPFIVHIKITDTSYISEIQDAIINYLENGNQYLIEKRKLKIKEIESELAFISMQLNMLDTLKRKNYNVSNNSIEKAATAESNIYQISYDLYKKKQELSKKLEMPMNLYVIDDAIVPSKNNKPYLIIIIAGLLSGFIAYMFMAYIVMPVIRYKES